MEKYERIRTLGRGNYGKVDLCRLKSDESGQLFAVKKVKLDQMTPEERKKALSEAAVHRNLQHPNIVSFKESFEENNAFYIVMEYLDGGDLEKKIQQRGNSSLPEREILFIFVQIVSPLSYLHSHHILHRDIKPQNCFLTKHGIVKIGDFGVARTLDQGLDLAKTVIGTPFYLAPEIWDNHPYGPAADIYSLGVLLYEMCTLKKPFDANSATELLTKVMKHDLAPLPTSFSKELRDLVKEMLLKDPSLRPTAEEILKRTFIQDAIKELVEFNKKQIDDKPSLVIQANQQNSQPRKNPKGGRQRLLLANLAPAHNDTNHKPPSAIVPTKSSRQNDRVSMSNVRNSRIPKSNQNGTLIKRNGLVSPGANDNAEMTFDDDFVEFDDDFIDDEEENEFEDDFVDEEDDNDGFNLLADVTLRLQQTIVTQTVKTDVKQRCDDIRKQVKTSIGNERFDEIYRNLKDLENPECLSGIMQLERKYKASIDQVKELIELEKEL